VLGGLLLGLVVVELAALERQRLLVVGDRLFALALLLIGAPAIGIGPGNLGIEADRLVEIGESKIELARCRWIQARVCMALGSLGIRLTARSESTSALSRSPFCA
jgi:hypothetical protein